VRARYQRYQAVLSGVHDEHAGDGETPARALVHPYAERGSPKFEKAAMRWLERYLSEGSLWLQHFAEITSSLAAEPGWKRLWSG